MPDCWSVNINPVSGELILRWSRPLDVKGEFPLSLDLTYRAQRTRTTAGGEGFARDRKSGG